MEDGFMKQGDELPMPRHLRQVAVMLADGKTNEAMAEALSLAVHTIENAVWELKKEFGARDRVDYTVMYNNTPGKFTFQVDSSAWPYSGYQVNAPWAPSMGQMYAELQNYNSQMPGTSSDAMGMFDSHIYYSSSWSTFNGPSGDTDDFSIWPYDGPYYGTTLYIWDADC
jgi:hypothetical protein